MLLAERPHGVPSTFQWGCLVHDMYEQRLYWTFNMPPSACRVRKNDFSMASNFMVGNFVQECRAQLPRMLIIPSSGGRMQNTGLLLPSKLKPGFVVQAPYEK